MSYANRNLNQESPGFETTRLKLSAGWSGRAALSDSSGKGFTLEDWLDCLSDPSALPEHPDQIIKSDGGTTVLVKNIKIADKNPAVVVKYQHIGRGIRNICRAFFPTRAIRNFNIASKLLRNNIPTAHPLAGLRQRKGLFARRNIYITEYIQNGTDLNSFLHDNTSPLDSSRLALRKDLCAQIARIFASLHNMSLWHRDAKAGNFLVCRDEKGRYKITLVDMDGIKQYAFRRQSCRFRCLSKLASTLLWHRSINRTDYLRTFTIYCNLTGLDVLKRRGIFCNLARRAVGLRLLTLAKSAMAGETNKTK